MTVNQPNEHPGNTDRLKHVFEGYIEHNDEQWFVELIFLCNEDDDPTVQDNWNAQFTVNNTIQLIPLPVFIKLMEVFGGIYAQSTK